MSFTSVAFSSLRVLYIKCTTCFSWYATRFRVICITLIKALTANREPALRVRGVPPEVEDLAVGEGASLACAGSTLLVVYSDGVVWSHLHVYGEYIGEAVPSINVQESSPCVRGVRS